jgi:hypothetical protein
VRALEVGKPPLSAADLPAVDPDAPGRAAIADEATSGGYREAQLALAVAGARA